MKYFLFILCLFFITISVASENNMLLECYDIEDGDIIRVQIYEDENGQAKLIEFYEDGKTIVRDVKDKELRKQTFKLNPYYDYSRTIKKNNEELWIMKWGCGEAFDITCVE